MSDNGLQVTNGPSIPQAKDTDFVFNTKDLGGMHIHKILQCKFSDATRDNTKYNPYTSFNHNLGYAPAVLGFGLFGILYGCQNFVTPEDTVYADANKIFVSFGTGEDITVIIFAEKIN